MPKVHLIRNPFTSHLLSILRDRETRLEEFRAASDALCKVLVAETMKLFPVRRIAVRTPQAETQGERIDAEIVAVPILRSGIAMFQGLKDFLPEIRFGFLGLQRDEETAVATQYYCKLPSMRGRMVILMDPMLATGGSADQALERIVREGADPRWVFLMNVIAAPEGIERVTRAYPEVTIVTTAIDQGLNEQKFIVPGIGDYGDRYFGTDE